MTGQPHTLRGFGGLRFEFWMEPAEPGTSFDLFISAAGSRDERERWLHAFKCWCELHGLRPEIIHGNSRTHRTATRTLVACSPSIPAFLFQWMGDDWHRYIRQDANAVAPIEKWQIVALRQRITKLEERLRQAENRNESVVGNRQPRRSYSTRLAAFARLSGVAR